MLSGPTIDLAREAVFVCIKVGAPILLVALVVGLVVSFVQAITQIQEPTLTFVPKIIGIFATMILAMPFMLATLLTFTEALFAQIGAGL
ncbi:MAG: flagellar biosynthesis protein FliQ [Alphaproteobacteria bacterium]